jgi:hypothetical protein
MSALPLDGLDEPHGWMAGTGRYETSTTLAASLARAPGAGAQNEYGDAVDKEYETSRKQKAAHSFDHESVYNEYQSQHAWSYVAAKPCGALNPLSPGHHGLEALNSFLVCALACERMVKIGGAILA